MADFTKAMFPFYLSDKKALGRYLGVSGHQVRNWLNAGEASHNPERVNRISRIGALDLFPLDDCPDSRLVGRTAHLAYEALRDGNEEFAEAVTHKALAASGPDWVTGQQPDYILLERFFLQLVNGIAWARNVHQRASPHGLPALAKLRRRVQLFIHTLTSKGALERTGEVWAAWEFLWAMSSGYWLCNRIGDVLTLQTEHERKLLSLDILRRHRASFLEARSVSSRSNIAAMNAWNLAQLAGVCGDVEVFQACLDVLEARYKEDFHVICDELKRDDDTKGLLKRSGRG